MSDETEVYVGRVAVPDSEIFGWRAFVETAFSEADFYSRPRARTHRLVRDMLDHLHIVGLPEHYSYVLARAKTVRKRLLIQGYTDAYCARAWDIARRQRVASYQRWETASDGPIATSLALMKDLPFQDWKQMLRKEVLANPQQTFAGRRQPWDAFSYLDGPNDALVQLAILADIFPRSSIWMDCSSLYGDPGDAFPPHEFAREEQADEALYPTGKIIVLTEGKSDTRLISAALRAFYPEYADAYQFLDFDEFRIEGGASLLAKMVKVLAGARVQNRMLAIFDNDAAGVEALQSLKSMKFPRHVRLMTLPSTTLTADYPTLGPGGPANMDVNGAGAPIELYLGRSSLLDAKGELRPIRWQEWKASAQRYQGVVQDKDTVARTFEKAIASPALPKTLRKQFPEMDLLLRSIFVAFEDNAPPLEDHRGNADD